MSKLGLSEIKRLLPTIVLAVCCPYLCAASLDSQTDEVSLKSRAESRRNTTEITVEKLIDLGRLQEAREKLREQIVKEGERPRLLLFEAMILHKEKQYLASIRKLERVLSLNDGDPDVYKLIGLNLVSMGKEDLAERYFVRAVELAPRDFMARYYLGLYQLTSKQFARAEAGFQEVIKLNPKYVEGYQLLGWEWLLLSPLGARAITRMGGNTSNNNLILPRRRPVLPRGESARATNQCRAELGGRVEEVAPTLALKIIVPLEEEASRVQASACFSPEKTT